MTAALTIRLAIHAVLPPSRTYSLSKYGESKHTTDSSMRGQAESGRRFAGRAAGSHRIHRSSPVSRTNRNRQPTAGVSLGIQCVRIRQATGVGRERPSRTGPVPTTRGGDKKFSLRTDTHLGCGRTNIPGNTTRQRMHFSRNGGVSVNNLITLCNRPWTMTSIVTQGAAGYERVGKEGVIEQFVLAYPRKGDGFTHSNDPAMEWFFQDLLLPL